VAEIGWEDVPDEPVYAVGVVARALKVSTATLRLWMREGHIDYVKLASGHRRIPRYEIDRLERTHKKGDSWPKVRI
jgi:excisionase family DNA binding protein